MAKSLGDTVELRLHYAERDVERAREYIAQGRRQIEDGVKQQEEAEERVRYWKRIKALEDM